MTTPPKKDALIKRCVLLAYDGEDDCIGQDWALAEFWKWRFDLGLGLKLTKDRRIRFNKLVGNINNVLRGIVEEYQVDPRYDRLNINFVDWSMWPAKAPRARCATPRATASTQTPSSPELMFFKPNTKRIPPRAGLGLEVHDVDGGLIDDGESSRKPQQQGKPLDLSMGHFYDSPLYKSPNPDSVARAELDPRAPNTPTCPGDNDWKLDIPDSLAKWFHHNVKGHAVLASFALKNVAIFRAKMLNLPGADVCKLKPRDDMTCHGSDPSKKAFVTWFVMDDRVKEWCNDQIKPPANTINWERKHVFHPDTPDEFEVVFRLTNGTSAFNKAHCLESYARLVMAATATTRRTP